MFVCAARATHSYPLCAYVLQDMIEVSLRMQFGERPGIRVLGNRMKFDDETGLLEGFVGRTIHSLNKNGVCSRKGET